MSFRGAVFRVSFRRLAAVRGSKAVRFLAKLAPRLQPEDAAASAPTSLEALRQLVMGEPLAVDHPQPYAEAFHAVCREIGYALDSSSLACAGWTHVKAVDAALASRGLAPPVSLGTLFSRGLPVLDLPCPQPSGIGFLMPIEVAAARGCIRAFYWLAQPKEIQATILQLAGWIEEAAGEEQGLVGFCRPVTGPGGHGRELPLPDSAGDGPRVA